METKNRWAVITRDQGKAKKIMEQIAPSVGAQVVNRKVAENKIEYTFENGVLIRWINPYREIRGHRIHCAWIDESLRNTETMQRMIKPLLVCSTEEDIHWI